ncbi:hypothetical protein [Pseudomonas sp. C32]|uniref:hypothetical protein n=1 Tax=Pseudomonas sp. C32 TaxID=1529208 RepID=UPI00261A4D93|nr:hypothetical protein [Pseudomonas sp. C32]MDN4546332.1 hypothetical protein [Pseudomonas sp. C32]
MNKQSMQSSAFTNALLVDSTARECIHSQPAAHVFYEIANPERSGRRTPFCGLGHARLSRSSHPEICVAPSVQERGAALTSVRLLAGIHFRS